MVQSAVHVSDFWGLESLYCKDQTQVSVPFSLIFGLFQLNLEEACL